MNFIAEGKIIHRSEQSGISNAGREWKKVNYVLETIDIAPSKIPFSIFGNKTNEFNFNVGDSIRLVFSINGREYNGKWYVDINGESAETIDLSKLVSNTQSPSDMLLL